MVEKIVHMQVEDKMVTFEKEDGTTIIYPVNLVPQCYKEGDIIRANILPEGIEFLELDVEEMELRRMKLQKKKRALIERIRSKT